MSFVFPPSLHKLFVHPPLPLCLHAHTPPLHLNRNLSSNKLAALPLQHMDLPNATAIDLSQNTLSVLPEITAPLLEQLDLTGNFMRTLPESFRSLKHLTKLFVVSPPPRKICLHHVMADATGVSATTA